ncbi:hypothetical protein ACJMK2_024876, partial [Sinanodonta woodiana]
YSIPEIYNIGDNATVIIDKLPIDRSKSLQVFFSCFTKKEHVINVIFLRLNANIESYIQVNTHYSGRIQDISMDNSSLTFILLNVNLMDSGTYTVLEGSFEKGKRSILVT